LQCLQSPSRRIVEEVSIPCILAGGIGPENVVEAVKLVKPAGVDSKTRTDLAGGIGKDLQKVKAIVEAVRRAST
jgi:phosphoribosylanthranilate isomerase